MAREMLVKEMRQRNVRERTGESTSSGSSSSHYWGESSRREQERDDAASGMYPTEETPQHHQYPDASAPPQHQDASAPFEDVDDIDPQDTTTPFTSISQRIQHVLANCTTWYHSQSEDIQTLLKVLCVFLVLYILLGGRFGIDYALGGGSNSNTASRRGNYGEGNAYDRYSSPGSSSRRAQYSPGNDGSTTSGGGSSGYNDRTSSQNSKYYSRYESDRYYEPQGRRQSTSWHMVSLCGHDLSRHTTMLIHLLTCFLLLFCNNSQTYTMVH